MKFHDKVQGMNIFPRFPRIMLNSVSFPFDQVAQFPVNHLTIQDLFHNPLFFSVYDFWKRGGPGIGSSGAGDNLTTLKTRCSQLMEGGKLRAVCIVSDFVDYREGA